MGTNDTSRSMFDPRKHYTSKWTLQGRLITDFDENDREAIGSEERRRARLDIIGAYGSPDDGFRVANVRVVGGRLEFDLLAGSLYLGGMRLEQEDLQTYRTQRDDLQAPHLSPPGPNQLNRRDLVLLEAYEAPVTAVEDGELLDPAVGVDTSARGRRFQRIRVLQGGGAKSCDQAWQLIAETLAKLGGGALGPDHGQVVDTRLKVSYTEEGTDDELCEPPLTGGYLGAENQAIRVQLRDHDHLTWGYDNASPLYRVTLSADRKRVTLITPPRDLYSTPVVGQVIEILPWGALLSNGEKTAALSGHLTRITEVDPSDEAMGGAITITLAEAVPVSGFDAWKARPDAAQLSAGGVFYYMHIWNRGGDVTSPPAIPFTRGTPLTLGTTGIQVTITGDNATRDDYWIIAARPETPTQVFPWELEAGAAPEGVRRFYAPLALIRWKADGSATVSDCRPPFRPLTAIDGCCSFSVGDGKTSDGDYNDLATALERLGANGGEICLLAGVHRASVSLVGRDNITISGCGSRSKLIPLKPEGEAVIALRDCSGIGLFNFEIVTVNGTGIAAELVDGLRIEDMKILAQKTGVDVDAGEDVAIRRCTVRMLDKEGGDVGIYAQGDRLLIEECDIQIIPGGDLPRMPDDGDDETPPVDPTDPCADPQDFYANLIYLVFYTNLIWGISTSFTTPKNPHQTLGGVQIGSGSEDVLVRQNTIIGGAGNGITLGSDIADIDLDALDPPPGTEDEIPEVRLTHEFETVRGRVMLGDDAVGQMTISFADEKGSPHSFAVDASGIFGGKLPPGEYIVSIVNASYGVVRIEPLGRGDYFVFVKEREGRAPPPVGGADLLAFIHTVRIEHNQIAGMGFSGIGAPRFTTADAAALQELGFALRGKVNVQLLYLVYIATGTITGFVVDLTIYRNTIARCLQNAPLTKVDQFAIERALGGISLALCDGVSIEENVIESCGRGAELPVCGVFISFSIDVTLRENHILNNGQDRRAEQLITDFIAAPSDSDNVSAGVSKLRKAEYAANQKTYNRYRAAAAAGSLTTVVPDLELGRGPRAGILLPICMSANLFAGGAARKASASLSAQGLTGAAEGRHAARIDGNYVVQPFGKTLFVGAAGPLSITDNQLIGDRALTRELDALAGGLSGRIASNLRVGILDLFASNVMVVDICPGAYVVDLIAVTARLSQKVDVNDLKPTPIPFGFPDGNVLFAGNQIKQGDAGARATMVSIFSLDDVNFVDNQIDVLNATGIVTTSVVLGATARAANNRIKEPLLLALNRPDLVVRDNRRVSMVEAIELGVARFSLVEIAMFMGSMLDNQGHYCFRLLADPARAAETANLSGFGSLMQCGDSLIEEIPGALNQALWLLLIAGANFASRLSRTGN